MKYLRLITTIAAVCFFIQVNGQNITQDQVPASVLSAFSQLHPEIASPVWSKEKWGHYEATFTLDNHKTKVVLNANGLLQRTQKMVAISEIPDSIKEHGSNLLQGYSPYESWLVTTPDEKLFYLILVKKGKDIRYLTYGKEFQYMGENYFDDQKNRK